MKTVFCVWILGIYATLITVFFAQQAVSGVWKLAQLLCPTPCTSSPGKEQEPAVERKEQGPVEWKCISYSLYQQSEDPPSPVYTDGFLLNVDVAHVLFPTWKIHL